MKPSHRFLSFFMVCILLFSCAHAATKKNTEEAAERLTVSEYTYDNGTVVVTGTRAVVDFELMHYEEENCRGWFYQEELGVNHPIMQGETDTFYIKRNLAGSNQKDFGCLCLPTDADPGLTEDCLVFYGRSGGTGPLRVLQTLCSQEAYESSPYLRLLLESGDLQLDIFAVMDKTRLTLEELTPPEDSAMFDSWLSGILGVSKIQPLDACLPSPGDRVAILLNDTSSTRRVMLATVRPIRYETEREVNLFKYSFDHTQGTSGTVDAGPLGKRYVFFQTDPVWGDMRFESVRTNKYRHVSGGACGPFALANILINMLDPSELVKLNSTTANGEDILFCSCSVNELYCNHNHFPYRIQTAEEFARYLPIVLCNFCAGNNRYGVISRFRYGTGTTTSYVPYVCEALNLKCESPESLVDGLRMIEEGGNRGALLVSATEFSPYSRVGSHFLCIIAVHDGLAYVVDSLEKTSYKSKNNVVQMVNEDIPGLSTFPVSHASQAALSAVCYIEPNEGVALCDHTYPEWEFVH